MSQQYICKGKQWTTSITVVKPATNLLLSLIKLATISPVGCRTNVVLPAHNCRGHVVVRNSYSTTFTMRRRCYKRTEKIKKKRLERWDYFTIINQILSPGLSAQATRAEPLRHTLVRQGSPKTTRTGGQARSRTPSRGLSPPTGNGHKTPTSGERQHLYAWAYSQCKTFGCVLHRFEFHSMSLHFC